MKSSVLLFGGLFMQIAGAAIFFASRDVSFLAAGLTISIMGLSVK